MSPAHAAGAASLEGGNAFRLAQGRFPPGLPAHECERLRRNAMTYLREVCFRPDATHYQMLCLPMDAKRDAIKESYHLLMALIHPDRAERAREAWPADWAQRANRAYAVLSDDVARKSYDRTFAASEGLRAAPHPRPRRTRKSRGLVARVARACVVLGLLAALLVMLTYIDSTAGHFPFNGASSGRDIGSGSERPRFLGLGVVPARDTASATMSAADPRQDRHSASRWRDAAPAPAPAVQVSPAKSHAGAQAVESDVSDFARDAPAIVAASAAPVVASQAPVAPPARPEANLTSAQIEILVARLIGYYEAGETDNLMALLDSKEPAARTRQAYLEFFRATRQRRLQVKSLDWQAAPASARAQGQATVQAQYVDAPGNLERDIDVEMEIALRNGQAKITRLSLFPNGP